MDVSDSFRSATRVLVGIPTAILPVFLAASGSVLVPQVLVLLGVIVAYLLLAGTGRIDRFAEAFAALLDAADGGATPGTGFDSGGAEEAVVEEFGQAVAGLFPPEVVAVLVVSSGLAILLGFVVRGVVVAGTTHAAVSALYGDPPVEDAIRGADRDWRSFVGYVLLRMLFVVGPTLVYFGAVAAAAAVFPALGILAFFLGGVVWFVVVVAGYLLLLFVPQAIAVENVGVTTALRHNLGFLKAEPGRALVFVGLSILVWVGVGLASFVLQAANVGRLLSLVVLLAVTPWMALFKTALYVETTPPSVDTGAPADRFRATFRRGGRELLGFVPSHPGSLALCTLVFGLGAIGGYLAVAPYALGLPAPEDPGMVFGSVPIDDFLTISANNWLVAVSQAFAGLAAGVPALSNLLFNGLLVGVVMGFGFELPVAAALVVPHAIIEVPALLVSGALGVHLGRYAVRYLRADVPADALAGEMRRVFRMLLALAPVFVVAGAIEAFVTPLVAAYLL